MAVGRSRREAVVEAERGYLSKPPCSGSAILASKHRSRQTTEAVKIRGGSQQGRNHYGCNHPYALVLAMRYVIIITAVTFFLIWDGIYNQGRYLDRTIREVTRVVHYVTSMV
ncbi:hypothetical protein NKI59_16775 [Mesorhizobium sp. M0598]|uniref:hypothetical protein n=1 Tax=Mesorhizobium sp. M0598 TaxID=2956968 RepID=UPI003339F4B3